MGSEPREVRAYSGVRIDGTRTVNERIWAYRQGRVRPMVYRTLSVPVVACRQCEEPRPDDGTPCRTCEIYQHWDLIYYPDARTWLLVEIEREACA